MLLLADELILKVKRIYAWGGQSTERQLAMTLLVVLTFVIWVRHILDQVIRNQEVARPWKKVVETQEVLPQRPLTRFVVMKLLEAFVDWFQIDDLEKREEKRRLLEEDVLGSSGGGDNSKEAN